LNSFGSFQSEPLFRSNASVCAGWTSSALALRYTLPFSTQDPSDDGCEMGSNTRVQDESQKPLDNQVEDHD